jgi:hypothetical protein
VPLVLFSGLSPLQLSACIRAVNNAGVFVILLVGLFYASTRPLLTLVCTSEPSLMLVFLCICFFACFIHLFNHLFVYLFICSIICLFIYSFVQSFAYLLTCASNSPRCLGMSCLSLSLSRSLSICLSLLPPNPPPTSPSV